MSDQELIDQGLEEAETAGGLIDPVTARIIAGAWHGGQASALYALSSSGTITERAASEVRWELDRADTEDRPELTALLAYVEAWEGAITEQTA